MNLGGSTLIEFFYFMPMLKKHVSLTLLSLITFFPLLGQESGAFYTRPLQPNVRSLQVLANSTWGTYPILRLGSADYVTVSFDIINSTQVERLRYKLIHCDTNWTLSNLLETEYLDGFNDNIVEDYASSQATSVNYVNYKIEFPNNDAKAKLSGNYVMQVYEEDNPEQIVLTACFYVLDKQVDVLSAVSSNTDWGMNKEFQQVSFTIDHSGIQVRDAFSDISTVVLQNRRQDNQKSGIKPTFLNNGRLIYEHNRDLIFEAGNEYRRVEFVSTQSGGMNVDRFRYQNSAYVAQIIQDKTRAGLSYLFDRDQNGRFLIRNSDGKDSDLDGDYVYMNFSLKAELPLDQPVFLSGDFTYGIFGAPYQMKYNELDKAYELSLLLKLGAYNYMYLTQEKGVGTTKWIEGNYYQTENEYLILVYYRPIGQRYDSLIGYSSLKSQ